MGEIADMMLNGLMCEGCGVFMDDFEETGYPRYCSEQCARDRGMICEAAPRTQQPSSKKFACPECGKRFRKDFAVADHRRAAHGTNATEPKP